MLRPRPVLALLALTLAPVVALAAPVADRDGLLTLREGWQLQSSAKVSAAGEELSTPAFKPSDWHQVTLPTTVVAALVKNKVLPDPYFGMNMRELPGGNYKIASNFSNADMPADSPYQVPWWFRNSFTVPASFQRPGGTIWLKFQALNYRANVWLNGQQIGRAAELAGAWRSFELNVTKVIKTGAANVLVVQVFPQQKDDLGITFVDWNPTPPDKNMGLWRDVQLSASGPLAIRHPAVMSTVDAASGNARLTVTAVVKNGSDRDVEGVLQGVIKDSQPPVRFEQAVTLKPGEHKDVVFDAGQFPQLALNRPRLWWPAQMGKPELHQLELEVKVAGQRSDVAGTSFGIREVQSAFDANKRRFFTINGKRLLIRGAGWSSDMMMREDPRRQEDELRYVQDMGLNTLRLEGKLENQQFFDWADRQGLLIMAGWCCCDHWEKWSKWKPEDRHIAAESQRDQLYRLRAHPSLFAWFNASDMPPPADVEKRYLQVAQEVRFPNPIVSSAAAKKAEHSGDSGVKMWGPYEWVPPRYWLEDTRKGGAYGFNTETSPGPAVPPIESLRKMIPADKLWPINEHWNFHAGGGVFKSVDVHTAALEARYGKASDAVDYTFKSQLMAYEGIRAMFEAFSRNKYTSTGLIQWMLNNAWPGIIWHLYDYYLLPGGGYFGAKVANQPLLPLYSYPDGSIWAVNSTYQPQAGLTLSARVLNLDMTEKFAREVTLELPPDGTKQVLTLPPVDQLPGLSPTYFLQLIIKDATGKQRGSNFYWLSTAPEKLAYEKTEWFVTPAKSYADFTALRELPKVKLKTQSRSARQGDQGTTTVRLHNPSKSLAFFVRLKVNRGKGGDEVLPVLWQDNYVSLLPGEQREITARYRVGDLGGKRPEVELQGWNLAR
jgi:exo-1,4-beta-D-glucosaminidase